MILPLQRNIVLHLLQAVSDFSGAAFPISACISPPHTLCLCIFRPISGAVRGFCAIFPHSRRSAAFFCHPYSDRSRAAAVVYFGHTTDTHGGCDTGKTKKSMCRVTETVETRDAYVHDEKDSKQSIKSKRSALSLLYDSADTKRTSPQTISVNPRPGNKVAKLPYIL